MNFREARLPARILARSLPVFLSAIMLGSAALAHQSSPSEDPQLQKGIDLYRSGHFGAAARAFDAVASAKGANAADAYYWLGLALFQNRQGKDSMVAFEQAIEERGGEYPRAEAQLGALLLVRNKIGDAIHHLHKAISESNGDDANAHYNLGIAFWRQENYQDARAELYTAITLRTPYPEALHALGMMLFEQKKYDESEGFLKRYVQAEPQHSVAEPVQTLLAKWDKILAIPEGGTYDLEKPNITHAPQPKGTRDATGLGVTGRLIIEAVFTKEGTIEDPFTVRGLGFGLDQQALRALARIKFKPAQQNLTPVTVRHRVEMIFE